MRVASGRRPADPLPGKSGRTAAWTGKEAGLRARVRIEFVRRGRPWKAFRPERWYPADVEDGTGDIRLRDGSTTAVWPRAEVEIRGAADDEWEIRSASRMALDREGQTLEYPGRVAECPEGHARTIPSRFDRPEVSLTCPACRRQYRLVAG
jgi:hypothetical protein